MQIIKNQINQTHSISQNSLANRMWPKFLSLTANRKEKNFAHKSLARRLRARLVPVCQRVLRNAPLLFLILPLFILTTQSSCQRNKVPEDVSYYTCTMHPQIRSDQPGNCPICHMELVPVKKTQENEEGITLDPSWTQQIGIKTEKVKIRLLHKSFLIQGKVAFDPKLWVAQKEYLLALKLGDKGLIKASEEKLFLLGLSKAWIGLLKKHRRADLGLYLPTDKGPNFLEAFLYQGDAKYLTTDLSVEILDLKSRLLGKGMIRALGSVVDIETQTLRALIQSQGPLDLPPNSVVQFKLEHSLGSALSVPKEAILFNGDHNMIYLESAPGKFLGRKIELGKEGDQYFEVTGGLKLGEKVVTNGHFLIDAETQNKSRGPSGGHQH